MREGLVSVASAAALLLAMPAAAQDNDGAVAQGSVEAMPAGVKIARVADGFRLVDAKGKPLYALNPREARARAGNAMIYCAGECAQLFAPLIAPANAPGTGLWKAADSPRGSQWTYKGSPVFTYVQDRRADQPGGEGYADVFRTMEHVPPAPTFIAPAPLAARYDRGQWHLADENGRAIYTLSGPCTQSCEPLRAGLAARAMGQWTVVATGDIQQWAYRGKPAFIAPTGTGLGKGTPNGRMIVITTK